MEHSNFNNAFLFSATFRASGNTNFKRSSFLLICLLLIFTCPAFAQIDEDDPYYGIGQGVFEISGGFIRNDISNKTRMLIPEEYDPSKYSVTEKPYDGMVAVIAFATRLPNAPLFFYPDLTIGDNGAKMHYQDVNNTQYDIDFAYKTLGLGLGIRYNPLLSMNRELGGIHLYGGTHGSITIDDHLRYTSMPDPTGDPFTRDALQGVFKGKANMTCSVGLGYDYHWDNGFGLTFDARKHFGLSDVIETKPNNYYFSEQKNQTKAFSITLGVTFALNPD